MIYLIADTAASRVKIGYSADPWLRFNKIQADCPGELTMLALLEGDAEREAELHAQFAQDRVRGEWFRLSAPIADFVAAMPKPDRGPRRSYKQTWGQSGMGDCDLAPLVGVAPSTLNRIRNGKVIPSLATAARIVKHAGVTYEWLAELTGVVA